MVHAARPQPRLRHGKAFAPATEQVVGRHAHVAKDDLAMPFGRVVVYHADVAHHLNARRVQRHQQHAVLVVLDVRRTAFVGRVARHHDQQPAGRVRHTGDEPLAAVEHQAIALVPHRRLQVGRIG
ncbi:hypothetical protein D9M69_566850 [compost metagenome]